MASKTDENGPFKEFVFEDWLREGVEGMVNQAKFKRKKKLDTAEFETHLRNSVKEQLLAVRSLVDSFIDYVEKEAPEEAESKEAETKKA